MLGGIFLRYNLSIIPKNYPVNDSVSFSYGSYFSCMEGVG